MKKNNLTKKKIIGYSLLTVVFLGILYALIAPEIMTTEERVQKQITESLEYINSGCPNSGAFTGRGGTTNNNTLDNDKQKCLQAEKFLDENFYNHDKVIMGKMKCISGQYVLEDKFWGATFNNGMDYDFTRVIDGNTSTTYITGDDGNISKMNFIDNIGAHFKIIEQKEVENIHE